MVRRRVVVLTGADLGAAAGVPAYRGLDDDPAAARPATLVDLYERPRALWTYVGELRRTALAAAPGPVHELLAAFAAQDDVTVVTRAVDDLHERAGSPAVHHLHGALFTTRCTNHRCGMRPFHDPCAPGGIPTCPQCASTLRPDVLLSGESVARPVRRAVDTVVARADVLLVVGPSPAAGTGRDVLSRAAEAGVHRIWLAPRPPAAPPGVPAGRVDALVDALVDEVVEADVVDGLARLLDTLTFAQ